jgi:hypothetical protein
MAGAFLLDAGYSVGTVIPRFTAGRMPIASNHRCTFGIAAMVSCKGFDRYVVAAITPG